MLVGRVRQASHAPRVADEVESIGLPQAPTSATHSFNQVRLKRSSSIEIVFFYVRLSSAPAPVPLLPSLSDATSHGEHHHDHHKHGKALWKRVNDARPPPSSLPTIPPRLCLQQAPTTNHNHAGHHACQDHPAKLLKQQQCSRLVVLKPQPASSTRDPCTSFTHSR